ncbi:hypothetical protein FB451DRAFT_1252697 [Mycena latifolia]|nr:hypothetical protein FB451DRAFT_1252697 [Mycena latifolia]
MLPTSAIEKLAVRTMQSFVSAGSVPEAATELFLSGSFQTLVGQFGGILRDKPEHTVPGTDISSGGKFERQIFCRDEMLIIVREKQSDKKFLDALSQVLCELFAAWHLNRKSNKDIDTSRLIPAQAWLCDAADTYFLSYDGVRFRRRIVRGPKPPGKGLGGVEEYAYSTLKVHNYMFASLVEGYYHAVKLHYERSSRAHPTATGSVIHHETTKVWYNVLRLAYESRAFFQRAHEVQSNQRAEEGLKRLFESLDAWPAVKEGTIQLLLPTTIEAWTESIIQRHEETLTPEPTPKWDSKSSEPVSATDQERRQLAVKTFWERLPKCFQTQFEPMLLFNDDSFQSLALIASDQSDPDCRQTLEMVGSKYMVQILLKRLQESHREGHWELDNQTLTEDPDPISELKVPKATVQERRQLAVETFWERLPDGYRKVFEPFILSSGDSFTTLATAASDPNGSRRTLETAGSKGMVHHLLSQLEESHREGHWEVLSQELNAGPAPTCDPKFPKATVQERRQPAVESFWQRLPSDFRPLYEPYFQNGTGDSFVSLRSVGRRDAKYSNPVWQMLEEACGPTNTRVFRAQLNQSQDEGHWNLL